MIMWGAVAKAGGTAQSAIVGNTHNPMGVIIFSILQFVDFSQLWYICYPYLKKL